MESDPIERPQRVLGTGPVSAGIYAAAWLGIPLIFGLDYARKRIARSLDRARAA